VVVVSDSEYYTAKIEHFIMKGKPAKTIHCTVNKWNKTIYKQMLQDWKEFRTKETDLLYAVPPNHEVAKFARRFNFTYFGRTPEGLKIYTHEVV